MRKSVLPLLASLALLNAPAMAAAFPAPLDSALSDAETTPKLRLSYSMRYEAPGEAPVTLRFDAQTRYWSVVEGDPGALSKNAREKLNNIKKSESVPGGLLYADFRKYLRAVEALEETETQLIYRFLPPEAEGEDAADDAEEVMRARLYVDKADGKLARYEVVGLKPFKPLPVAKMEEFVVEQDFERLEENGEKNGPAVLVRLRSRQKGERFFRKVDTDFTAHFFDFERVE